MESLEQAMARKLDRQNKRKTSGSTGSGPPPKKIDVKPVNKPDISTNSKHTNGGSTKENQSPPEPPRDLATLRREKELLQQKVDEMAKIREATRQNTDKMNEGRLACEKSAGVCNDTELRSMHKKIDDALSHHDLDDLWRMLVARNIAERRIALFKSLPELSQLEAITDPERLSFRVAKLHDDLNLEVAGDDGLLSKIVKRFEELGFGQAVVDCFNNKLREKTDETILILADQASIYRAQFSK